MRSERYCGGCGEDDATEFVICDECGTEFCDVCATQQEMDEETCHKCRAMLDSMDVVAAPKLHVSRVLPCMRQWYESQVLAAAVTPTTSETEERA
jgi:hypothetical protein